jgi:hypothetical protein
MRRIGLGVILVVSLLAEPLAAEGQRDVEPGHRLHEDLAGM